MVEFERIGSFETWPVEFGLDGKPVKTEQVTAVQEGIRDATDLLVISHGWNNDEDEASGLYRELLGNLSNQPSSVSPPSRRTAVLRVYWPSKKFADKDLIPGGASSASSDAKIAAIDKQIELLIDDFKQFPLVHPDISKQRPLEAMRLLLPDLEGDDNAQEAFVRLARTLLSTHINDEEEILPSSFRTESGAVLLQKLSKPFRPRNLAQGGATSIGSQGTNEDLNGEGGAVFLGNVFSGILNGARNFLNLFTYYEMKERAGLVGSVGLVPVLKQLQDAIPSLRLHLCGHSFGGRLVTAALASRDDPTDVKQGIHSVTLLQAAFSHNGFGIKFDGVKNGFFRQAFEGNRLSGPVVITHTARDRAVGLAYPIASRLRNQVASGIGDSTDPYGAIGRNGALFVVGELDASESKLRDVIEQYGAFRPRKMYNLEGGEFIDGHSDVCNPQVAHALRHALDACLVP